jgi:ATP-dependent RNA helicase RhlE
LTTDFSSLGLSERTVASLDKLEFTVPTEVQSKTIGLILDGLDVIASAQTGTGKTAAFALPFIERFQPMPRKQRAIRALILVPTRELALQVKTEFERLSKHARLRACAFYGGTGYGAQLRQIEYGIDVAIATPGRLNDLLERGMISLSQVQYLVLDEADRMLDMGFTPQVRRIVNQLPEERQTLMFTATLDRRVESLAADFMNRPVIVRCKQNVVAPTAINQQVHRVPKRDKEQLLLRVLAEAEEATVLIFTRTRHTASKLTQRLRAADVDAEEIHGDIKQNRRERTIARYRDGYFNVLVATDIAARGLDVPSITHVVNYDLPDCAADYVHRIGRTGRAGRAGIAHSFVSEDQLHLADAIQKLVGTQFIPDDGSRSHRHAYKQPKRGLRRAR